MEGLDPFHHPQSSDIEKRQISFFSSKVGEYTALSSLVVATVMEFEESLKLGYMTLLFVQVLLEPGDNTF